VVAQAPQMLFLSDTDGDGRADERVVLSDGWPRNDTHGTPSNLRYGLDNQVLGSVGYNGFRGTVGDRTWRRGEFGAELEKASRLVHLYYRPAFIERVIRYGARSGGIRTVLADLVMGRQSYLTLRRRLQREVVRAGARRLLGWLPYADGGGASVGSARA
ncbi:MAG: hypothetical protein KY397_06255, partial [Gemmatimonadetes bacterium]|nr:hypothetical protein [Gemmatimonadota bacterium]